MNYMTARIKRINNKNRPEVSIPPSITLLGCMGWSVMATIVLVTFLYIQIVQAPNVPRETIEAPTVETLSTLKVIAEEKPQKTIQAHVTGYNTVPEQTDATPCISATGDNICGRRDVVACPRSIKLGTEVEIDGKRYTCLDRTSLKYDGRFDISCDKDMACPYEVTGYKTIKIYEKSI